MPKDNETNETKISVNGQTDAAEAKTIKDSGKDPNELVSAINHSVSVAVKSKSEDSSKKLSPRASTRPSPGRVSIDGIRGPSRHYLSQKESKPENEAPKNVNNNNAEPSKAEDEKNESPRVGKTITPVTDNDDKSHEHKEKTEEPGIQENKKNENTGSDSPKDNAPTNLYMYSNQTIGEIASQLSGTKNPEESPQKPEEKNVAAEQKQAETNDGQDQKETDEKTPGKTEKKNKKETPELQNPKVFDTTQYHLPISAKHHKKASSTSTAVALIFLIILVIAVGAGIYFHFIKLDFLKNIF